MWWAPTSMTKNQDRKWAFCPRRPETQLHDILWAVHEGKNRGRSEGEENLGELPVMVGGWGQRDVRFSHMYARVCETLALTEAERGVGL